MKQLHGYVSGRVQGVFFRAYTQKKARSLGLNGWVRNLPDGRVEVLAEGDGAALRAFEAWLHQGSPLSHVTAVEATYGPATGKYHDFEVVG